MLQELIKDTIEPRWATSITVDYMFEIVQEMTIKVYHAEGNHPLSEEAKHTHLGDVTFVLADLVRAQAGLPLKLTGGRHT